jgi:positive phototaxis protein PixI
MNSATTTLQPEQHHQSKGEPYLCLQLEHQTTAILPMQFAREVTVVAASRLTMIPNMPQPVLGLLNQRSRIFWVVDLPQLLGMTPLRVNLQQYNLVITEFRQKTNPQAGNLPLGLAIPKIQGIIRIDTNQIQSPIGTVPSTLVPYLQGCILQDQNILLILDPEAIVNSPLLMQ